MRTLTDVNATFSNILTLFANLPDDVGPLTAVMTRATYYKFFAPQTLQVTSTGALIVQNRPALPDGTPIVIVSNLVMPDNKVLLGDYKKYVLLQRHDIVISRSEHVKFIEDQTIIKATARYDGRPVDPSYFLLLSLDTATAPAPTYDVNILSIPQPLEVKEVTP